MAVTVENVMRCVRNFFEKGYMVDTFSITGGQITPRVPDGIWYAVEGSMLHDGVYGPNDALEGADETFAGRVWLLAPPRAFLMLCEEIAEYDKKNPVGAMQSESFGNYSYSRAGGQNGVKTGKEAYALQLTPYRRMFTGVCI